MTDAPLHVTAEAGVQASESQDEPESGFQRLEVASTEAEIHIQPQKRALAASTVRSLQGMNVASCDRTA